MIRFINSSILAPVFILLVDLLLNVAINLVARVTVNQPIAASGVAEAHCGS